MTHTEVVESYVAAWRDRDPEAIAAHFAPDGIRRWEFVVPPLLDQPTSRQTPMDIVKPIRGLLTAIPELTLDVLQWVESDTGGICEWRHAGTHTGTWDRWTPQGEWVEFFGVSTYRISDDRIAEECIYFDPDTLIRNWVVPLGTLTSIGIGMLRQRRQIKKVQAHRASG